MTSKRSYNDACATAHALDIIGERWALLVARELVLGPKRFTDLRAGLPNISPNVLTQRLEELERSSVVRQRRLPPPASTWVYELTDWGMELEPVIMALGRWGARSPALHQDARISADALILSFLTMFDADAAVGFEVSIELRLNDDRFHAEIADGQLEIARGSTEVSDVIIETEPNTLASVVYGGRRFTDVARAGELKIYGDNAIVKRFMTLFPLPEPAVG